MAGYEIIDNGYSKQSDVQFTKDFLLKFKTEYNVYHFVPVDVTITIQQFYLRYGLFYHINKIKRTIILEADK